MKSDNIDKYLDGNKECHGMKGKYLWFECESVTSALGCMCVCVEKVTMKIGHNTKRRLLLDIDTASKDRTFYAVPYATVILFIEIRANFVK